MSITIVPTRRGVLGKVYPEARVIGIVMIEGLDEIAEVWVPIAEIPALIAWLQSVEAPAK